MEQVPTGEGIIRKGSRNTSLFCFRYRKPVDWNPFCSLTPVDIGTALITMEKIRRFCGIAVDFPKAAENTVSASVLDKSAHVLGRITQKQADLMRKIFPAAEPPDQLPDTPVTAQILISCVFQKRLCFRMGQIEPEPGRTV